MDATSKLVKAVRSIILAAWVSGSTAIAQEAIALPAASTDQARATIVKAIDWIERQAVAVKDHEGAVLFPATEESKRRQAPQIYGGTAGVLIFLENAAAVLDDLQARALADATARGLLATSRRTDSGHLTWMPKGMREGAVALYVGDAGVGQAFLTRAKLRDAKDALATAVEVADSILARGEKDGDRLSWDEQVEIIYGAAGTVLFLLDVAEASGEERFTEAALAASRWMIEQATAGQAKSDPEKRVLSWKWQLGGNAAYLNFSHGTAGVAYALARVGEVTKDQACREAAIAGAESLLEQTVRTGELEYWPVMENVKQGMGGWCHGPPGTARLFLLLHQQTKDQRYLDAALASARWVMAQAPAEGDAKAAAQFPPSLCCGVAGVLDFFCDLHRATGEAEFKGFAGRASDYLIAGAVVDGNGVKWPQGATHEGRKHQHAVDLMLGTPGEALALLRWITLDQANDPISHLPDRRVRKP